MDGHPRQNPAYRPATGEAPATGLLLSRGWFVRRGPVERSDPLALDAQTAQAARRVDVREGLQLVRDGHRTLLRRDGVQPVRTERAAEQRPVGWSGARARDHAEAASIPGRSPWCARAVQPSLTTSTGTVASRSTAVETLPTKSRWSG